MALGLYQIRDWLVGAIPTGAQIDAWLDAIAAKTSGIDRDRIHPDARFPVEMFAEDGAYCTISAHGFDYDGNSTSTRRYHYEVPADGTVQIANALGVGSAVNRIEDGQSVLVASHGGGAASVSEGDVLQFTIAAADASTITFKWRVRR